MRRAPRRFSRGFGVFVVVLEDSTTLVLSNTPKTLWFGADRQQRRRFNPKIRPFSLVLTHQSIMRRQLDARLTGMDLKIGPRPEDGWIRTIRRALKMSTAELGERMSLSQQRAWRLEQAEVDGSLGLSTLRRAAEALDCSLAYVFVPDEPLEDLVLRQAHHKAEQEISLAFPFMSDREEFAGEIEDRVEARTLELIDTQGLWREAPARARTIRPFRQPPDNRW